MVKRWVFGLSLVSCLIGISLIKPISAKAEQYCKCEEKTGAGGTIYCIKDSNWVGAVQDLWECKQRTDGKCVDKKCQIIRNSKNNEITGKCVCSIDGIFDDAQMGCNDSSPISIGSKTFPQCEAGVCTCLSDKEINGRDEAEKQKSAIERVETDKVDPFCTAEGFGVKQKDGSKRNISGWWPSFSLGPISVVVPLRRIPDTIKIRTALGCISINFIEFIAWIFEKGFGIVGAIAFILLIGAFIQLATSEGDVKKIQGAKELITSTVTGLLLSIFSIFIIRLLMITILRIPGLK